MEILTAILDAIFNGPQLTQAIIGLTAGMLFGAWVFNPMRIW